MTRLWAFAGITRSTAGAEIAPRPARSPAPTTTRREIPERRRNFGGDVSFFGMRFSLKDQARGRSHSKPSGYVARFFEMLEHFRPQRRLLLGSPLAEAFARFEAELALGNERLEVGRRSGRALYIGQHRAVNGEREIRADEIGVLERTENGEPASEACFDHGVDGLGVADAVLDQSDRLAPQRMLQAVADKARDVLLHVDRHLSRRLMQRD